MHSASAQSAGRHHDVAVLDAGVELDAVAAELGLERLDDLGGVLGGGVPAGEVDHRAVGADGDEVAAVGDLVGPQLAGPSAAASIGARPVWYRAGS